MRSPDTSLTAPDRKLSSCLAATTLLTRSRQGQQEGTQVGGHPEDAAGACAWSLPQGDVLVVPRSPHAARAAPSAVLAAPVLPHRHGTSALQRHQCSAAG